MARKGYKIALKLGCPGCGYPWGAKEGQCSRCKRCLQCCGLERVEFSCADRYAKRSRLDPGYAARSERAYNAFHRNPKILPSIDRGID
jgi:hypothetical protein